MDDLRPATICLTALFNELPRELIRDALIDDDRQLVFVPLSKELPPNILRTPCIVGGRELVQLGVRASDVEVVE